MDNRREVALGRQLIKDGYIAAFSAKSPSIFYMRGGVYNEKGEHIKLSDQIGGGYIAPRSIGNDSIASQIRLEKDRINFIHKNVFYIGVYVRQWGHFLIDVVNRLYDLEIDNYYYVYCSNIEIEGNYRKFLECIGITKDKLIQIKENEIVKFDKILVQEEGFVPGLYYTEKFRSIYEGIWMKTKRNLDPHSFLNKKIYLSRRNFSEAKWKEAGEASIQKFFVKNGFEVFYPEQLTLEQQIILFNYADQIAFISGTIGHNILFSSRKMDGNPTFIVLEKTSLTNNSQIMIEEMIFGEKKELFVVHIPIYKENKWIRPKSYGEGPFLLYVTDELSNYFNTQKVNQIFHINYFSYCSMLLRRKIRQIVRKVYYMPIINKLASPLINKVK